ncbi:MAG: hypothetical protein ACK5Q5_00850 [Planctomycetaceae bacterium]
MTEIEKDMILSLALGSVSDTEFRRKFRRHSELDGTLVLQLLREALRDRDKSAVECAMIAGRRFGSDASHVPVLLQLLNADWHQKHEDIVSRLGELRPMRAIDYLFHIALRRFDYLDYDDARALGTTAVWALDGYRCKEADQRLLTLSQSDDVVVANCARDRLRARRERSE